MDHNDFIRKAARESKSSFEESANPNSKLVAVPKIDLLPREIQEAVNTEDSFSKIVNKPSPKKHSRSPVKKESPRESKN